MPMKKLLQRILRPLASMLDTILTSEFSKFLSSVITPSHWGLAVGVTYLFILFSFADIHTFTDLTAWVLFAVIIELCAFHYSSRHFRFLSFLFFFSTLLILIFAFNMFHSTSALVSLLSVFSVTISEDLISSLIFNNSSLRTSLAGLTAPDNFLFYFSEFYSGQQCNAYTDFALSALPNCQQTIVNSSSPAAGVQYIMDADSNPLFFTLYNLHFFGYELLFFFASVFLLFASLFLYNSYAAKNQLTVNCDCGDVLYRLTEVLLLFIFAVLHFSRYQDFIASIDTFSYSFVFNNLLSVHPTHTLLKDFLIFLFLFFNFFFRLHSFALSRFKERVVVITPPEIPFLLVSILIFCSLLVTANDLNLILVALEGITFITAVLIAFDSSPTSAAASIKYFTLGVASSGFFSMASALTYGLLLNVDFKSITDFFYFTGNLTSEFLPLFVFTTMLITLSFFVKLSVFPGNFWVLDIYNGCSFPIISLLVLVKCLYFFVFAKLYFSIYAFCTAFVFPLVVAASLGSMLFSAYGLLTELHLKQFVAYSSTGQFGFLMLTLVCYQDANTFLSIFLYLFYYATVMLIFFFSILRLTSFGALDKLTELRFCQHSPVTAFFFVVSLLSLAGLPPFFGFFAKISILFNLAAAGFSGDCLLLVFLLNVAMSFGYVRALRLLYFNFLPFKAVDQRLAVAETEESLVYLNNLSTVSVINNNPLLKFSYFFYFACIQLLVFIQVFGFYFFGYIAFYLDPLVTTFLL